MFFNDTSKICDKAIFEFSKGNHDSLSTIYDCMARVIFSSAYAILKNYQDSEDVLQETMIQIAKYAHSYQIGSNAKAWILSMTRHISIDVLRKRKNSLSIDEGFLENNLRANDEYFSLELQDILNILDDEERQIIIFRLYAKLPYKEISKIMDINISSLHKKYQRAIKKIKNNYEWRS